MSKIFRSGLSVKGGVFTADSASVSGSVFFTSGSLGNWTVSSSGISSGNITSGSVGPFTVSSLGISSASGTITASNGTFTGNLTASAGKVYLPAATSAGGYQIFYGNYDNTYIALGASALQNWVNGNYGTYSIVLGYQAFANLSANNGGDSIVIGNQTLYSASTVSTSQNVAIGNAAMTGNPSLGINTLDIGNSVALGWHSMYLAKGSIQYATAVGTQSMQSASGGSGNTAVGNQTMGYINGGNYNTALGSNSGKVTSVGSYNLSLGYNVYPSTASLSGTVQIGTDSGGVAATATASNQIVLGTVNHSTNIPGAANVGGNPVYTKVNAPYQTIPFSVTGTPTAQLYTQRLYNDTGSIRYITGVRSSIGASATASTSVDVLKNGTSIFSSSAARPLISASGYTSGIISASISGSAVATTDYLQVQVISVGSGASDLTIQVMWS